MKKNFLKVFIITTLLVLTIGFVGCFNKKSESSGNTQSPIAQEEPTDNINNEIVSPITGLAVNPSLLERQPLAVMVENSPQARPQSGMNKADIVYEMLAEGGISRFMLIFYTSDVNIVGPVRSARPYFMDRMMEYNAIYARAGGSHAAYQYVKDHNVDDIDGLRYGKPNFWRDNSRYAPHNYYSNTSLLRKLATKKGYVKKSDVAAYTFLAEGDKNSNGAPVASLKIDFHVSPVTWKYDTASNAYLRFYSAKAHRDRETNEQLSAKNIIVQYAKTKDTFDKKNHIDIDLIGRGKALLFQNGEVYDLTWEKDSITDSTKYTFVDGSEMKLLPGQTWIEVVRLGQTKVSYPKPKQAGQK